MQDEAAHPDASPALSGEPRTVSSSQVEHDRPFFYVAESAIHGLGVFAGRRFTRDEVIGTYEGAPTQEDGTYVLWLYQDDQWRGIEGTGPLRFLNHACEPNADFDGCELYALRDIAPGEEITFHYGEEWEEGCEDAADSPPGHTDAEEK